MHSSSTIGQWAYVAACVLAPMAWGALTAWLFSRRDRKRSKVAGAGGDDAARPTIDYMI